MAYIIMRRDDCEALRWNSKLRGYGYRVEGEFDAHETSSAALLFAKELKGDNFVINAEHHEEVRALYARRKPNSSLYAYSSAHEIDSEQRAESDERAQWESE